MATNNQVTQNTSAATNPVNTTPYFVGFNTVGQPNPPYSLTDIEIVKRDILNQFATPMGTRLMLPGFGTNIYSYLFDPFDDYTKNLIIQDAVNVVESDPRVQMVDINVTQTDQALTINLVLLYVPQAITTSLFVSFSLTNQESF